MRVNLSDGIGSLELRYIAEDTDRHGNTRIYYRHAGRKVRLRETPGTPEFLDEYKAARAGKPYLAGPPEPAGTSGPARRPKTEARPRHPPRSGSFRWLCLRYFASDDFTRLQEGRKRRAILEEIFDERFNDDDKAEATHGDKPFSLMRVRHVYLIRDAKAATGKPEAANARVKTLRQVFKWAIKTGNAEENPARDCEYVRNASEGFHTWTVEEVFQFWKHWPVGTVARLAADLFLFTGVRVSDGHRLGPDHEREGGAELHFTEYKGRNVAPKLRQLPILPVLRATLDASPTGKAAYIVTVYGEPFSVKGLGNKFREWCDAAKLPHCSAHGLRKAGATIAAENSATVNQLMAIYGWTSPKQAAVYTRKADRRKLAAGAMHLINPGQIVPPKSAAGPVGQIKH